MTRKRWTSTVLTLQALGLGLGLSGPQPIAAQTMVDCDSLPNPVYLQVGDTQEPLMKALGRTLRDTTVHPQTLIYKTSGSCVNTQAIFTDTKLTENLKYIPSTAEDSAWTTASASPTCTIAAAGHAIDVANSALLTSACPYDKPADIGLFKGPDQAYVFAVPSGSSQTSITAEAAYFVFGFGSAGGVTPWTDESQYFIRTTTKSTLLALAANIRVPGAKWKGTQFDGSPMVVSGLQMSTNPEASIGILGDEIYDKNRNTLKVLAYRAYDQKHAYFPDSRSSTRDKRNIRDGHYTPWSPTIWMTKIDTTSQAPVNAEAERVIKLILGENLDEAPAFNPLDTVISVGLVPECAMKVTRDTEGGDLSPYQPQEPCNCYFEKKVDDANFNCKSCDSSTPCDNGQTCRHGYCEAK
jgi:hypothetical protein